MSFTESDRVLLGFTGFLPGFQASPQSWWRRCGSRRRRERRGARTGTRLPSPNKKQNKTMATPLFVCFFFGNEKKMKKRTSVRKKVAVDALESGLADDAGRTLLKKIERKKKSKQKKKKKKPDRWCSSFSSMECRSFSFSLSFCLFGFAKGRAKGNGPHKRANVFNFDSPVLSLSFFSHFLKIKSGLVT